jgi:hypothetical protein
MTKALAILTLLGSITFFSYGCTVAQRKELLMEAGEAAVAVAKAEGEKILKNVLEELMRKAAEKEKEQLAILDAQLAKVAKPDSETGVLQAKTWKDFDADKDTHLSPTELASLTAYVAKESGPKSDQTKTTAGAAAILAALWAAAKAAQAAKNKLAPKPAAPAA